MSRIERACLIGTVATVFAMNTGLAGWRGGALFVGILCAGYLMVGKWK